MSRSPWKNAAVLAAIAAAAPLARGQQIPPVRVETRPVEVREFPQQLTLVGRTRARAESRIVAEVAGRVEEIAVQEGRRVQRGAPLVTIDSRRVALDLAAKRAEETQAAVDAQLTAKELERARDLVETSVFPQRNLDAAAAAAARATARQQQLEAERQRLELDLASCTIRAPYDGYAVRRLVDLGEWVDPGAPVYELVDLAVVEVTVDLPERHFGEVSLGSPVEVAVAREERPYRGKVTGIAPRASESTHTFPVILAVANPDGRLGAGMLVRATLELAGTFTSLAVAKDALVREGERTLVYAPVDGAAVAFEVTPRGTAGSLVAVEGEGLTEGLPVVVRGNERIFPGSPLQVAGEPAPVSGGGGR